MGRSIDTNVEVPVCKTSMVANVGYREFSHWRCVVTSLLVVTCLVDQLNGQSLPDFSGNWRLETFSSFAFASTLSVTQTLITTNARGEAMQPFYRDITIRRELVTGTRTGTYRIGVTGGVVRGAGPSSHQDVKWAGNVLVLSTGDYTGERPETGVWHEREERWRLLSSQRLETVVATRGSDSPMLTVSAVYVRQ